MGTEPQEEELVGQTGCPKIRTQNVEHEAQDRLSFG